MINTSRWTWGAEHEFADHPLDRPLPEGYGRDRRDVTMVNSNGIANDPKGKSYRFGGEINTPPTTTRAGQVDCLHELLAHLPEAKINYRSNLHLHIRVPGLREDLGLLKRVQLHIHIYMREALQLIEPLPRPSPTNSDFNWHKPSEAPRYLGELRRWRRRRVSHQTLLTPKRLARQLEATTVEEFFAAEVPQSSAGKPQWHFQPRLCVNVRQLLETDTIEFRHFPGTMDPEILGICLDWCHDYLCHALEDRNIGALLQEYKDRTFPPFPTYDHEMETRYRRTCHGHTMSREEIDQNIKQILEEENL